MAHPENLELAPFCRVLIRLGKVLCTSTSGRVYCVSEPCSGGKGVLSLSEVVLLLLLSEGSKRELVLGLSLSESSGLLVSEVIGSAALLGVSASLVSSLLVDNSKHLSDGLSDEL